MSSRAERRYIRQELLREIGPDGQRKLSEKKVAVVGCGALGSVAAVLLARMGIGALVLIDREYVEWDNLHRQLYDEADAAEGVPKAIALKEKLEKANSEVSVEARPVDLNHANVESLLRGSDLVVDGTDNMETRFLVNDYAVKSKTPWVYGAAVATYGVVMSIVPEETACLRCVIPNLPPPGSVPTCETVGVLPTLTVLVATLQATEAVKILLGKPYAKNEMLVVDPWYGEFSKLKVRRNPRCKTCSLKEFEYLEGKVTKATSLCGRNTVQVLPPRGITLNLESLARRLERLGRVRLTRYVLFFEDGRYEIAVFLDGRAIIKGVEGEEEARSVYTRYIGL